VLFQSLRVTSQPRTMPHLRPLYAVS
jgi:hypothetical protein